MSLTIQMSATFVPTFSVSLKGEPVESNVVETCSQPSSQEEGGNTGEPSPPCDREHPPEKNDSRRRTAIAKFHKQDITCLLNLCKCLLGIIAVFFLYQILESHQKQSSMLTEIMEVLFSKISLIK